MSPLVPSPESVVEDGEHWLLAVNRNQNLLGKTMLVLRRPCSAVVDIQAAEWMSLHAELARVTGALEQLFQPDQMNYAFLMNLDAQVHLHVIPRYSTPRVWSDTEFADPNWGSASDHEQRLLEPALIGRLSQEIRDAMPV